MYFLLIVRISARKRHKQCKFQVLLLLSNEFYRTVYSICLFFVAVIIVYYRTVLYLRPELCVYIFF